MSTLRRDLAIGAGVNAVLAVIGALMGVDLWLVSINVVVAVSAGLTYSGLKRVEQDSAR